MTWSPRLRDGVRIEPAENGEVLVDSLFDRRLELDSERAAAARLLDGSRPLDAVLAGGGPGTEVLLRRLLLLNFIDGAGTAIVDKYARLSRGEEQVPYSILEGARFECQGSGECCQNYVFGPLEDADIARLEGLDLAGAFPHVAPPYIENYDRDGEEYRYLRSVDDRCVFLEDGFRCGLHARWGADAKPRLCRQYPMEHLPTLAGIKIYDKGTCATFARSARSGLPLVDDLPRVRALLPERHRLYHPVVLLGDGIPVVDYGHYLRFIDVALALVKRRLGTAADTVRALARGLTRLAAALAACPLRAGEPDATIDEVLREPEQWYPGEPDEEVIDGGGLRIAELAERLLHGIGGTIGGSVAAGKGYMSHRLLREVAQPLHLLAHEALRPRGGPATVPYYDEVAAVTVAGADIDEVLRISLRQKLFGSRSLVGGRAFPAMLRLGMIVLLTVWYARLRAAQAGRGAAVADDLSYGHMLASRLCELGSAEEILSSYEEAAPAVLEVIPAIARLGAPT